METVPQTLEYSFQPSSDSSAGLTPFTVHVFLDTVLSGLRQHIELYETYIRVDKPPPGYRPDRLREYTEDQAVLAWLASESASGFPHILWDTFRPDRIRGIVLHAVCDHSFATIYCESCKRYYTPAEIDVETWRHHTSNSDSHGGRKAHCPKRHLLSKTWEWLT